MSILPILMIPTLVIFAPIIALVIIRIYRNRLDRPTFIFTVTGCVLSGFLVPLLAVWISLSGFQSNAADGEGMCLTGLGVYIYFGYLVNLIGIPLVSIVLFVPRRIFRNLIFEEVKETSSMNPNN